MKNNGVSIDWKIQAWCEGKIVTVTKTENIKHLTIPNDVDEKILGEYQQLVWDEIYWRLAILVFDCNHEGWQIYITLKQMIRTITVKLNTGIMTWNDFL